jgi:hypothetical protein
MQFVATSKFVKIEKCRAILGSGNERERERERVCFHKMKLPIYICVKIERVAWSLLSKIRYGKNLTKMASFM